MRLSALQYLLAVGILLGLYNVEGIVFMQQEAGVEPFENEKYLIENIKPSCRRRCIYIL
jgi:hypothetical protein